MQSLRFTSINGIAPDPDDAVWVECIGWLRMRDLLPMWTAPEAEHDQDGDWTVLSERYGVVTLQSIDIEEDN